MKMMLLVILSDASKVCFFSKAVCEILNYQKPAPRFTRCLSEALAELATGLAFAPAGGVRSRECGVVVSGRDAPAEV